MSELYREPTDGQIMDALEHDLKRYHLAEYQRDVSDLARLLPRLEQRRAEIDRLYSPDEARKARRLLAEVDPAPVDVPEARYAEARPLAPAYRDETHLQRHGGKYAAALAVVAGTAVLAWLVIQLVSAVVALVAVVLPTLVGLAGMVGLVLAVCFLCSLGGGKKFSGTFQGRMH